MLIEQVPWGDSRGVRHVVGRPLSGNPQSSGTEVRTRAVGARECDIASGTLTSTEETNRRLLISGQCESILETADGPCNQSGVVPPRQGGPCANPLLEHVLHVRCRVELLVVINSKIAPRLFEQNAADARR